MNEQLLELERQFQNKQITEEQYQTEKSRLERESLFLGDFDNEIKLSPLGNTPIELSPSTEVSDANANYYRTFPNALSNILQYSGQSETSPTNIFGVDLPTGIQGQDNISYNDPQYNENQRLSPLATSTIENPNLNVGEAIPSGVNPSDEAKRMAKLFPNAVENITKYTGDKEESPLDFKQSFDKFLPFMNPYGSNIETELYSLGKFIGTEKGTEGRNLGIASSALSAGLGGARTLLSGLAQQKQTEKSAEEIRRQLALKKYTQQQQYLNQNSRGGKTS